jgi:hypothetical protein
MNSIGAENSSSGLQFLKPRLAQRDLGFGFLKFTGGEFIFPL